ncbi:MAG TPA: FKBP-type peptidyl-prolyl cis-trans isomerase [Prolixibacteraceae bacterium]|nr:FKBP-type peptidyl-prolyl cis-trans isomerase [Prolixibacteraceae bacterium]
MRKNFLLVALISAILLAFGSSSCFNESDNDADKYTPQREQELLKVYLDSLNRRGYDVDTTAKGVYLVKLQNGEGATPKTGDTLSVMYVGYLMDGTIFDASFYHFTDSCWTFVYKVDGAIEGWNEAMAYMNKGSRVEFIVPSGLAYGPKGAGFIPPYSSLIFVAKMKNIRPKQE